MAVACLVAPGTALASPSVSRQQANPIPTPQAPSNATAIASRISELESEVANLEVRLAKLRDDLGLAQARMAEASKRLGTSQRSSSALVAAARRQALAAYV